MICLYFKNLGDWNQGYHNLIAIEPDQLTSTMKTRFD